MSFSKSQLERLGLAYLAEGLYREGLHFARPDIDAGIDLIVYRSDNPNSFAAVPVQLKAFQRESFYTDEKYLAIPELFIVYLWHVGTKPIRPFGMKYVLAENIVDERGWSRNRGCYARTRGTTTLEDALAKFEVKSWMKLFFG
jgi:hypothetical protein